MVIIYGARVLQEGNGKEWKGNRERLLQWRRHVVVSCRNEVASLDAKNVEANGCHTQHKLMIMPLEMPRKF